MEMTKNNIKRVLMEGEWLEESLRVKEDILMFYSRNIRWSK